MNWFKRGIQRYDDWCKEMGLTPEQKRCCVPYRKDPVHQKSEEKGTEPQSTHSNRKSEDEAL